MTRLDQALRWWRGRKCECGCSGPSLVPHVKIITRESIPQRHFDVLERTGRLTRTKNPSFYWLFNEYYLHHPPSDLSPPVAPQ